MVARFTLSGFNIDPVDKVNQYLKSLEAVFLSWAERQRSSLRTMKAIGASVTALNLEFLMADILEEQRNLAFTTSKEHMFIGPTSFLKTLYIKIKALNVLRTLDYPTVVRSQIEVLITIRSLKTTMIKSLKTLKLSLNLIQTLN